MKYLELRELTYPNKETHALVYSTETNKYSVILKEYDKNHNVRYNENDNFISDLENCITHIIENTFKSVLCLANVLRSEGAETVALVRAKKEYNNGTIDIIEKEYYTLRASISDLNTDDTVIFLIDLTDKSDIEDLTEYLKRLSNEEYKQNFEQLMKQIIKEG